MAVFGLKSCALTVKSPYLAPPFGWGGGWDLTD